MSLTKQQQEVIDTLQRPEVLMVTCPAVAGAGKTHTLIEMAKQLNVKKGLYLAYNKSIQLEAVSKFKGTSIECLTVHSLAWKAVVKPYELSIGTFKTGAVKERVPTIIKRKVVDMLESFCLSAYTDPIKYLASKDIDKVSSELILKYLDKMANGEIQCTHSFYLKLYHIYLVSGEVPIPEVDLLMMDEAGDLTALTIEIFRLIKAPKKIAVGDLFQNIYSFNHTINGFKALANEAVEVPLVHSFRVSNTIAPDIEDFVALHLDPSFEFVGQDYKDYEINKLAYIARTNSGLLEMMFALMAEGTAFHTVRKIDSILELPLILANIGSGKKITVSGHWQLEKLRSAWEKNPLLKKRYSSIGDYIRQNTEDTEISNAFNIVMKHGPKDLNNLAKYARAAAKNPCNMILTTAHSSKGLEFDSVTIAPDLNESVTKALASIRKYKKQYPGNTKILNKFEEELRLYYTACSRAMYELNNAKHLD